MGLALICRLYIVFRIFWPNVTNNGRRRHGVTSFKHSITIPWHKRCILDARVTVPPVSHPCES